MYDRAIDVLMITADHEEAEFLAVELTARLPPGSSAHAVSTLEHALQYLSSTRFDLIVTDLTLIDSVGLRTVTALRAGAPEASIIVRARVEEAPLRVGVIRAGADDCLLGSGRCAGALFLATDYALERLLRRKRERVEQRVEKLEAVQRFAAGASHHFNNLLTVIIGNGHLARDRVALGRDPEAQFGDLLEAAEQVRLLTQHLMLFCSECGPRDGALDLNRVLADFEPTLRGALGDCVELVMGLGPAMEPVLIDRLALEQSLLIVALNRREAMHNRGRITLTTRLVDGPRNVHFLDRDAPRAPYVMVRVTDDGAGLSRRAQERLFEPFFSDRAGAPPQGVGLAAVHGVVRRAGGFVEVEEHPGRGSSLSICLPAQHDQAA